MSPRPTMLQTISNVALIATTELKRTLITRRGLISLAAFALVWLLLLTLLISKAPMLIANGTAFGSIIESESILSLAKWSVPEFGIFWIIAVYLFPMCCVVFAADQTASDKTRGTLKLLTLHTSRASLFFGRFVGLMLVQSAIIALALLSTVIVAAIRDPSLIAPSLSSSLFIWVNLLIVLAPYTALMALISLFAKSGMQAVNYAAILWILAFFAVYWLSSRFPEAAVLKSLFPGSQVRELVQHHNWNSLSTALTPALQTLCFLTGGLFLIHRIDL